jgi:DNA adenine methylase
VNSPLKYHGGKHYLANRIVSLMPPHTHYCEPYFGGGSVLLAKPCEGVSECVNDIDGPLTCFWNCLMNPELFDAFMGHVQAMPVSESLFKNALQEVVEQTGDTVAIGAAFFVAARQSLAGRCKDFAPLSKSRTRRGMNEQASAWLSAVEGLPEVHERMKRVVVLNREALEVIEQQDSPHTFFYLDPPYVPKTRTAKQVYRYETTLDHHEKLMALLPKLQGKWLLSGYKSELYDLHVKQNGWYVDEIEIPNHAASGKKKRKMTELLIANYVLKEANQ